jgi:menaquinone-dependent protoporphyrinogen oxidase
MAPILILFGTTDGHTRKIADCLAETLRQEGADIDVRDIAAGIGDIGGIGGIAGLRPELYAGVLVAAPVRRGHYPRRLVRWVRANAEILAKRPSVFLSICLAVLDPSPETQGEVQAIAERFLQLTGWRPTQIKTIAGAVPYTRYSWLKRQLMLRIVRHYRPADTDWTRDYEYTDWADLRAFAHDFHELVYGQSTWAKVG